MILLDTNVISEVMKPEPAVVAWLDTQEAATLFLSSVTIAEILFGVACLPSGKRKRALAEMFDGLMSLFDGRIVAFDVDAAQRYAGLASTARASGRGLPAPDGYIAAIAAAHGFTVATRDVSPFEAAGLTVINPWKVA